MYWAKLLIFTIAVFALRFPDAYAQNECAGRYRNYTCETPAALSGGRTRVADKDSFDKLSKAIRDERKVIELKNPIFNYFDLAIDGVCGPNGFASEADNFLAQAANYFIITEKRAVALTVKLTESGPGTTGKESEITLVVARPENGKPTVDCSRIIRSGYHRAATVKLTFNFYVSKEKYEVSSAVGKVTAFLNAVLSLESRMFKIPHGVVATAGAKVFLSDIDKLTAATNALLADFEKKSDDTVIIDINENEGGVAIPVGKRTSIKFAKNPRDSVLLSGTTYKGGDLNKLFESVSGQTFGSIATSIDISNFGSGATDAQRERGCSSVRGAFSNYVIGDDLLIMVTRYLAAKEDLFKKGYNCLTKEHVEKLQKLAPDGRASLEPYPGAFKQALDRVQPPTAAVRDLFGQLRDRLTVFAAQIKTVALWRALPESPQKAAMLSEMKDTFSGYLNEMVNVDGAGREPLFLTTSQQFTDEEIADQMLKWPAVANFGCFLPIAQEVGKEQKYILEALLRAETQPKPTIFHLQFRAVAQGDGVLITDIWATKLGSAKARFADKFKQGCGEKSPLWQPWKEMDDWTAERNSNPPNLPPQPQPVTN